MGSFSVWHLIFFGAIVYVVWRVATQHVATGTALHCTTCGHEGPAVNRTRGSIVMELALWLCLIIPGLLYSLWRLTTRRRVCERCGSAALIPTDTPAAAAHRRALGEPPHAG